ncbi:membrane protein [Enterococcus saigonensis]|uniref:Membrane protein n=1 Tax=Enterococcus saigonensis TaxID=1805431 RepID=A0A679IA27_9ENTE|nr:aromatic acid exporter family protein [Enterococcus saigonensis]BCA84889.1 membrane protein [Enterococcus saigonensis]
MNLLTKNTWQQHFGYALKIGIGSALAILLAELLELNFAASAGIITLLTISITKVQTWRLCLQRIGTFLVTVLLAFLIQPFHHLEWISYGIILVLLTFGLSARNLLPTLSVNAVGLTHLLVDKNLTFAAVMNEFWLLVIGLLIAIVVNHFQHYESQKKYLNYCRTISEKKFKEVFEKLAVYLQDSEVNNHVWDEIIHLEKELHTYTQAAFAYQQNRLPVTDDFYLDYFEMRAQQCGVLHNLHYEIKKLRQIKSDSAVIVTFLNEIAAHFGEMSQPIEQLQMMDQLVQKIEEASLPQTKEEFLSKARLYHILMDLEEFLIFKKRFLQKHHPEKVAAYEAQLALEE